MITVVGSANIDLIVQVRHLPSPGETVLGTTLRQMPGGKGANQAVAAARAGSHVHFVGRVGDDAHGEVLLRGMDAAGVDTTRVMIDEDTLTGTALITVDAQGENTIVVAPGANARLSPKDIDRASDVLQASSALLLQLEIPMETVVHAAHRAREAGIPVILNPAPAQPLQPELFRMTDVLVANEAEVAALTGLGSPVDPASSARMIVAAGTGAVVVTLGARGAVVVTRDDELNVPAYPAHAVDTTGAGDTFVGNLAHALERNEGLKQATQYAAASAAVSVQRHGAQPGMPTREETDRVLRGESLGGSGS